MVQAALPAPIARDANKAYKHSISKDHGTI